MARSTLKVNLLALFNNKGVVQAQKDLRSLGNSVSSLGGAALKAGAAFAAFTAGRALVDFGSNAIEQARDLERNLNGLESVFGAMTPQMEEFTAQAYTMGLSQNEAAKASVFLGSVLKQSGFAIEDTAFLTKNLISLATDLSIVFGYDVQEALLGMTALFRGEYDPIEKFGVAMKQSQIDSEQAALGLAHLTGSQERFAEQLIRVRFLFQNAQDSMGSFQQQSSSLFVQQQILEAQMGNLAAQIGGPLIQSFAFLINQIRPLIEQLGPALLQILLQLQPVIMTLVANKEQLADRVLTVVETIGVLIGFMAKLTEFAIENIGAIFGMIAALTGFAIAVKGFAALTIIVNGLRLAFKLLKVEITLVRAAIASTGIGLLLIGLGVAVDFFFTKWAKGKESLEGTSGALDGVAQTTEELQAQMDEFSMGAFKADSLEEINKQLEQMKFSGATLGTDLVDQAKSGQAAKDGVASFYKKMSDEIAKQKAKLELQDLGASTALIDSILGSGDQWRSVFNSVVANGIASVEAVQAMFNATTTGYEAAMSEWEQNVLKPFEEFKKAAQDARDAFVDFVQEFSILPSIESEMGKFESATVNHLASVEKKLKDAFDNGYLLEESYKNLRDYARGELATLQDIERQRDEILNRRNLAQKMIDSVKSSITASASLVNIMRNVQTEVEGIDVVAFAEKTLMAGGKLKTFKTALITNFVEPVEQARSKADLLVAGYRSVVERTREFVDNLKALKALGLDPMLFNQLVEAGVEAGGETAQALVDGGSATITEINGLFNELDALGAELGENTAQVMYGQGENFVNGIVEGLDSQLGELEGMATSLAESFTTTFESVLIAGIESAIAAAEAALARMPEAPGFDYTPSGGGGDGNGNGGAVPTPTTTGSAQAEANRFEQIKQAGEAATAAAKAMGNVPLPAPFQYNIGQGATISPSNRFPIAGTSVPGDGSRTTVNVYTSSSPSSVANSISKFTNTNPTYSGFTASFNRNLN